MSSLESQTGSAESASDQEAELAALRARVAELEQQLIELEAWSNRTLGAAQERLYWLDRWGLDLNALMERPGAGAVRATLRVMRAAYRVLLGVRRRLRGA